MKRRRFLAGLPAAAALPAALPWSCQADEPAQRRDRPLDLARYRAAAIERWEKAIAELEVRDRRESHPPHSILFVGSSSIRRWDSIAADLSPYHPIQRGYGGAKWSDVAVFAERLIRPHTFRGAVFFVGNDISGRPGDKSPNEVAALFSYVRDQVRAHQPSAAVFFVAVTPTIARLDAWPQIRAANTAVRRVCQHEKDTYFIGTESIFLDVKGKPRPELFVEDRLHLNRQGYIRWAAAIKSHLDTVLNGPSAGGGP